MSKRLICVMYVISLRNTVGGVGEGHLHRWPAAESVHEGRGSEDRRGPGARQRPHRAQPEPAGRERPQGAVGRQGKPRLPLIKSCLSSAQQWEMEHNPREV
eukprot:scaffold105887_cov32-Prasinocladus_malaysianus.AAC.3